MTVRADEARRSASSAGGTGGDIGLDVDMEGSAEKREGGERRGPLDVTSEGVGSECGVANGEASGVELGVPR